MDRTRLLTHIHHILNPWLVEERAIPWWCMQIMKNDTWSRSLRSHYWHPTSIYKSQTKPRFPDMTPLFSPSVSKNNACTFRWIISLIFSFYDFKKEKEKKRKKKKGREKIWAQFLTGREEEMTPRSVIRGRQSRMTLTFHYVEMPVDYSVNWRTEWDRQEERGKTKIELFGGETDILNSRWYAKYIRSCIYWQVFLFAVAGRSYAVIHFTVSLYVPMSDKQPIWVIF